MISSEARVKLLRQAIRERGFVRLIEAHSGVSALIGQAVKLEAGGETVAYDGFWYSSLTESASRGLPDVELVGPESRIQKISEILEVTERPIVVDGDTGRSAMEFEYLVPRLERQGVSAVVIEDKVFPKRNSLDASARQTLEDPGIFAQKIHRGKKAALSEEFAIIGRVESFIAGTGLSDALSRAEQYLRAGADGILIHSNKDNPEEVLAFAESYGKLCRSARTRTRRFWVFLQDCMTGLRLTPWG